MHYDFGREEYGNWSAELYFGNTVQVHAPNRPGQSHDVVEENSGGTVRETGFRSGM